METVKVENESMTSYKCRVEVFDDIIRVKEALAKNNIATFDIKVDRHEFWDPEWTFKCNASLHVLRSIFKSVMDAHVMRETLEKEEDYTGVRK
jgi:hypothetical protein